MDDQNYEADNEEENFQGNIADGEITEENMPNYQGYEVEAEVEGEQRTEENYSAQTQSPPRYQTKSNWQQDYRQPREHESKRVYYHEAVPTTAYVADDAKQKNRGIPGSIGFAFAASLLSLFIIPFFHEFLPRFLNVLEDSINYSYETYMSYFIMVLVYGGISALLAVLGLIFAPVGMSKAKRENLEGRSLGTVTMLISVVSLIVLAVSIVSTLLLRGML